MANSNINKNNIKMAIEYITAQENSIPFQYKYDQHELVTEDRKRYPVKYVLSVADLLESCPDLLLDDDIEKITNFVKAHRVDILSEKYSSEEAKNILERHGFTVEDSPQTRFRLTISATDAISTDDQFDIQDPAHGDNYKPLAVRFISANGDEIERTLSKGENKISNKTLPFLACQQFENQLSNLSPDIRAVFRVCQYSPTNQGIFYSVDDYKEHSTRGSQYLKYEANSGKQFVFFYYSNIFVAIPFIQECLERFGSPDDKFVLYYSKKDEKQKAEAKSDEAAQEVLNQQTKNDFFEADKDYSSWLISSKNMVLRGAPGTGKSYLARRIAAVIISGGLSDNYEELSEEQKMQMAFVQFHPSYDYTDFVEGLRPSKKDDGTMVFELRDGVFKEFVDRARINYEGYKQSLEEPDTQLSAQEALSSFFDSIELNHNTFTADNDKQFTVIGLDGDEIFIHVPELKRGRDKTLTRNKLIQMLDSDETTMDATPYERKLCGCIREKMTIKAPINELKPFVFIIDEINRGEISKIFGELFFAIDPGYRGKVGEVSTQYANMHPDQKFYVPNNVYIIGTMNDIDRSVDSFDFAMRRRFRFVELSPDSCAGMLDELDDDISEKALKKMTALNKEIVSVEGLNENYQIGPAYFLKLKAKNFDFNQLWTDYLRPLLQEYIHGMHNETELMQRFENAYGLENHQG